MIKCNRCDMKFVDAKCGFGYSPDNPKDRWFCWDCWEIIEQKSATYGFYD